MGLRPSLLPALLLLPLAAHPAAATPLCTPEGPVAAPSCVAGLTTPGLMTEGPPNAAGAAPAVGIAPTVRDNSCRLAYDGMCDEVGLGWGGCARGSDTADCAPVWKGGNDSCGMARDGVCDEPTIGTGGCSDGTDVSDCAALYSMRYRDNSCGTAFDGSCGEPGIGDGRCPARTDTVDCLGRDTLPGINDHYFGHDDRQMIVPKGLPWSAVGDLELASGGGCSGTVVGRRVVLTAAHCFFDEYGFSDEAVMFRAGRNGSRSIAEARIVQTFLSPTYRYPGYDGPRGNDWAFVTLDRDIGDITGTMAVYALKPSDVARIRDGRWEKVMMAGYPWDAPTRMIADPACRIVAVRDDDSVLHDCDMTRGDSGTALFFRRGDRWAVVAVVTQFFWEEGGKRADYLAVDSRAFARALAKYVASNGG